jgi:hypothetical protein
VPAGQIVISGLPNVDHYTSIVLSNNGTISALNGTESRALAHNGSGDLGQITNGVFLFQNGTLIHTETIPYKLLYNEVLYTVGNITREYRSIQGSSNEYEWSDQSLVYLPPATQVGSVSNNYYVNINGTNYISGSHGYSLFWMGENAGIQMDNTFSSYISNGTFIFNDAGYDYYHDGSGGYYYNQQSSGGGGGTGGGGDTGGGGGPPSSGTTTGNTSSGYNTIEINGSYYQNGTYSGTEYNNGSGGTYWSYTYNYESYGVQFTYTYNGTDEYGNDSYTYYYSDGNGSYYT